MKSIEGYNKLRGGYYTPEKISKFISEWAVRTPNDLILEPSCGDGSFLKAMTERLHCIGCTSEQIRNNVVGVELDTTEIQKAACYGTSTVCTDFFTYYEDKIDEKIQFDAIVGNPPFIRYQNFDEKYRKTAFKLLNKYDFHPNRMTNIWLPFLILSCLALTPNGRIGMVVPAELFQVDYAAEARQFLSSYFDSLTIITFKRLVFDDIQQEVVLLLGERKSDKKGIRVIELNGLEDLIDRGLGCIENVEIKELDHGKDKWVKYYLSVEELNLLQRMNEDSRITCATDLFEVNVGLVSGENDFFVLNEKAVKENNLLDSVEPIISRAEQVKGARLSEDDFERLVHAGKKVFFFSPSNEDYDDLPLNQQQYISWGEEKEFNKNYKCRIRNKWYYVPKSWRADAFLVRQANLYPRMILNEKHALVTDTLHKAKFCNGVHGEQVAAAFLNTYTFALSETLGRSYGGGVLTFEPGEMRKMRIPMIGAENLDFKYIDLLQRKGNIDRILEYTDKILLQDGLNLSVHEVSLLHDIWDKMRDRRLMRKK